MLRQIYFDTEGILDRTRSTRQIVTKINFGGRYKQNVISIISHALKTIANHNTNQ